MPGAPVPTLAAGPRVGYIDVARPPGRDGC